MDNPSRLVTWALQAGPLRRHWVAFLLVATTLSVPGPRLWAETAPEGPEADKPSGAPDGHPLQDRKGDSRGNKSLQAFTERWQQLSPEKRRQLKALARVLEQLPPATRNQLLQRLRGMTPEDRQKSLQKAREATRERAQPDSSEQDGVRHMIWRRHWRALPKARREALRNLTREERIRWVSQQRKRAIARLPQPLQERVRALPPKEQARYLREFWARQTAKRVFSRKGEIQAFRRLPSSVIRQSIRGPGPQRKPKSISAASWKRWMQLKPYERLRLSSHLRNDRPQAAPSGRRQDRPAGRSEARRKADQKSPTRRTRTPTAGGQK